MIVYGSRRNTLLNISVEMNEPYLERHIARSDELINIRNRMSE